MVFTINDPSNMVTKTHRVTKLVPVTTMKEVTEEVTEEIPDILGEIDVYPVQYRNYPNNKIHVQHAGKPVNRSYGFVFDFPGQGTVDVEKRTIPSLAETDALYTYGSLVITSTAATLIGINGAVYIVPNNNLPF